MHCIDLPLRPEGGKYLEKWIDDRDRRAGMGSGNTVGVGENKPGMEGGGTRTMWEVKGGEGKGREGKGISQQTGSRYGKGNGIPATGGRKML